MKQAGLSQRLTFKEAKEKIDMVDYLASVGHLPANHPRQNEYWYHSPFTPDGDRTPSFKIDRGRNNIQVWYDHSNGIGGDLIDFGMKFHGCSYSDLLQKFRDFLSLAPVQGVVPSYQLPKQPAEKEDEKEGITIIAERPIFKFYLKNYLDERCIPLDLANQYLVEVDYLNNPSKTENKVFTALGFRNDSGGYELRAKNFKASSAPKAPTFLTDLTIKEAIEKSWGGQPIAVFEGFFSFLSFQVLYAQSKIDVPLPNNYLVLNSLSFFRKSLDFIEKFGHKMLFLDNDKSGISATKEAMKHGTHYTDYTTIYKKEKDMNALLVAGSHRSQELEATKRIKL